MQKNPFAFLEGGGEVATLIKAKDWSATSIGKIEDWPITLRTILGTMLPSKYPMFLYWGEQYLCFYNDAFVPSFGIHGKHPSALGEAGAECWPHIWTEIKPLIDHILAGGSSTLFGGTNIPIFKSGKLQDVYWTFSHSPVRNGDGIIEGVLVLCSETVNEKLTEISLRESISELEFAVESAEMATFDYDPVTNEFVGNARLRDWFGVAKTGKVNIDIALEVVLDEDRERVKTAIQNSFVFENGGRYEIEYTIRNKDTGQERILLAKGQTSFDENQNPYRFNGIILDLTKQHLANRKIRESEESFRLLTQALPHLIWVTDEQGAQIYMSKSWTDYTGIEQIIDTSWPSIAHPEDIEYINKKWQNSLESGLQYSTEVRLKRNDGVYKWFKVDGVPLKNEDGKIVRWIGAFSDINDQRLREEQKDEFIAIASHEMKTPLTTAKGYLELLLLTIMPENTAALLYADKANQALVRLQSFITELLDVSKISHGKINYNFQEFNLIPLVREAVHNAQVTTKQHIISIDSVDTINIEGDKLRLMQVIVNLLSNAIKYSPSGTNIKVIVSCEADYVTLCVTDEGIGMGAEHLQNVFSRYYRVKEHAVHFQGLGVGLYISYEIIERHNGQMWVESEVGKGSKFYFRLPIIQ